MPSDEPDKKFKSSLKIRKEWQLRGRKKAAQGFCEHNFLFSLLFSLILLCNAAGLIVLGHN